MSALLAIDPDLRNPGVALFSGGTLTTCGVAISAERTARGPVAWLAAAKAVSDFPAVVRVPAELAIEYPKIYPIRNQKGDQDDILELAGTVGAIADRFAPWPLTAYRPHEWKGTVGKEAMQERILERLTLEERRLIPKLNANLTSDVIDAIGIGLHHLGRLKRKRVYARS